MSNATMNIIYVISSEFDYAKLISRDAGPDFANDYGIPCLSIEVALDSNYDIAIFDNRIQESELGLVASLLEPSSRINLLKICDPLWEYTHTHFWYKFAQSRVNHKNVHYLYNYTPTEFTAFLYAQGIASRFIHAPYVYDPSLELKIDHHNRDHKLIFSGAINKSVYPVRHKMSQVLKWLPLSRLSMDQAPHPGYPDIGIPGQMGASIGKEYLRLLQRYKFATVCSSRGRLELQKYRELAYAGVVPVGDMPYTFLDCPVDAWIPWRRNILSLFRFIKNLSETEEFALRFRNFVKERRHIDKMRSYLRTQLNDL